MNTRQLTYASLYMLAVSLLGAYGQGTTESNTAHGFGPNAKALLQLTSVPAVYHGEALRLILGEANTVARQLRLAERLPIEETNLVSSYITPPRLVGRLGAIGNVTTANYTYYCSVGMKFSYVTCTGLDRQYARLREQALSPISQMDTNSAYELASRWLSDCSMDVTALNRDCRVKVLAFTPQGDKGGSFVPVYWVYWTKGPAERGSVASVELFAPTKTLLQLRVEDPKYILRPPLTFTNLSSLLPQTSALPRKEGTLRR